MNKLLIALILISPAALAGPDYIDFRLGAYQHKISPSTCAGSGVSRFLEVQASAGVGWYLGKNSYSRISYSVEDCVFNDESKIDSIWGLEFGYKFDL